MRLIYICMLLFPTIAFSRVNHDEQTWVNLNTFIELKQNWQAYLEVQPRYTDYHSKLGTTLFRSAVGFSLDKSFSAWLGYAFIERTYPTYLHEDRVFLQIMHTQNVLTSLKIINRTRLEQRYFREAEQPSYRLRHMLRGQHRLGASKLAVIAYDEWFWNANSVNINLGSKEGFDQNRLFLGIGFHFGQNDQHLAEIGYLHQYVNGVTRDASNHILASQLTLKY